MALFGKKKKTVKSVKEKPKAKTAIEKELEEKEKQIEEEIEKKIKTEKPEALEISKKHLTSNRLKDGKMHSISLIEKGKGFEVKRIKVGVKGFDELSEGGLPEKSLVLVSGASGTGKSIFGMNYLVQGALQGEPGVYITLEENPESTLNSMKLFGWPLDELIEKNLLVISRPELYDFDRLLTHIDEMCSKIKAKRLVLDSISLIGMYFKEEFKVRRSLMDLGEALKRIGITTLAIVEVPEDSKKISTYGVEEFTADGVIVLYYTKKENIFTRGISVRKMRATAHSNKIHPIMIKRPGGIIVYPSEEAFTEF